MFKRILVLSCTLALISHRVYGLTLEPGRTDVVIEANASPTVRFAAEEMTNFLSRVLGRPVAIATAPATGRLSVFLGDSVWSRARGLDPKDLVRDGFLRQADGNSVFLVGRDDPREDPAQVAKGEFSKMFECGTLFAVYDFLERFADCRFFFPGELGTVVPEGVSVTVPVGLARTEPVFTERYFTYYDEQWCGAGYDERLTMPELVGLNRLRLRYGTHRMPCCHGQRHFRYARRFAREHPDWFCLQADGTRYLTDTEARPHYKNGKLCYSSPIREEIYQDVKAYLTGKPAASRGLDRWGINCAEGRYVDIMCEDSMMECHCPKCQAAYDKSDKMYATEFIWGLTADVADRLRREGVRGDVCQMAYPPYRRVPKVKLPPNVQVMVAENGPWSAYKPVELGRQLDEIRAWSDKLGHKVWLWTYVGKYGNKYPDCPQISPRAYAKFFREAEPWIYGAYIEVETDRFAYDLLNVYTYSRLAWNPRLDVEALIADWHAKLFGRGGQAMKHAFDLLEEIWMKGVQVRRTIETELGPVTPECSYAELFSRHYSPERMRELASLFGEAASVVAPGSREGRAIAMFRRELLEPLVVRAKGLSVAEELRRRTAQPARNLLANGSFDDNLDGWRAEIAGAKVVRDSLERAEGAASVRLTNSESVDFRHSTGASLVQPVKLVKGEKYRLSYFLKAENIVPYRAYAAGAELVLTDGGGLEIRHPKPPVVGSCDWMHLQFEFTARADEGRLQFRIHHASGTMWVDGVRLESLSK